MSIENTFDTAANFTQDFDVNKFKESLNVGGNTNNETTINQWNTTHQDESTKPPKSPTIPEVPVVPVTTTPALNTPSAVGSFQNAGVPGNLNTVNRVNELGSINDTVDISSDDLKMLRELAEIQAIQNFVELTPTVQVTTGNINNAGDIDTIINKIGQKLNEEFVSTAQGCIRNVEEYGIFWVLIIRRMQFGCQSIQRPWKSRRVGMEKAIPLSIWVRSIRLLIQSLRRSQLKVFSRHKGIRSYWCKRMD